MNPGPTATGVYVYCIAEGEPLAPEGALHPERPVYCIPCQNLFAVASHVSLEQFDREALLSRLADERWLKSEVRAHEAVIEKVMESRAVLPLKFCTVFRTEAGVSALLRARQDEFRRSLALVRGKQEWEVKLFVRPRATSRATPDRSPAAQTLLSGKDYLLRRAATALKASEALHAAYGEAQRTFEMLAGCAENIQLKPVAAGSPLSHAGLVWDAVCLLAASRVAEFRERVEALGGDLRGRRMRLRVSGPWPPYHFTQMAQDDVTSTGPA